MADLRPVSAHVGRQAAMLGASDETGDHETKTGDDDMNGEIVITEEDLPPQVLRAIELGRKVEAIKLLQDATGLGFANAKVLVDKAARHYGPRSHQPGFVEEETNVPALLRALLLVVVAFAVYHYYFGA